MKSFKESQSPFFHNLIEKDDSVRIRNTHIKILATKPYRFLQGLSPPLMNEIFM